MNILKKQTKKVINRTFEPGDIILTGGKALISRIIRWMTRFRGESKTIKNHAGIGVSPHTYVEALWTTKRNTYDYLLNLDTNIEIWRKLDLTTDQKTLISNKAIEYVGAIYAPQKIVLHGFDGLLGKVFGTDIYAFRRLGFMDRYPICSWVVAFSYDQINYRFGKHPKYVTPDCLHDYLVEKDDWKIVYTNHTQNYTDSKIF